MPPIKRLIDGLIADLLQRLASLRRWWGRQGETGPRFGRPTLVQLVLGALVLVVVGLGVLDFATLPPLPDYGEVRRRWQPSEAWLYDRDGVLIDSARVNFTARRLDWKPLN